MPKEFEICESVNDVIKYLSELYETLDRKIEEEKDKGRLFSDYPIFLFRGQPSCFYKLLPCVYREENLYKNEHNFFNKLYKNHCSEFKNDDSTFDRLARMQHYGLPTRLLDVTINPLIALYFACQPCYKTQKDGSKFIDNSDASLFIFLLPESYIKDSNSDSVSILSNLSRMEYREKELILSGDDKKTKDEFFYLISKENQLFSGDVFNIKDLPDFIFVEPKMDIERIKIQSGAFILFKQNKEIPKKEIDLSYKDSHGNNQRRKAYCREARIPYASKSSILKTLDRMNINEKYIFQDITHTANYLKEIS